MDSYSNDSDSVRMDRAIAEFLQQTEQGHSPNRREFIEKYPDLADQLHEFFACHDQLNQDSTDNESSLYSATVSYSGSIDAGSSLHLGPLPFDLGPYTLLEELDRGGMGVVFKARHRTLDRTVALKLIKSGQLATQEELQRFQREARAAANLSHPNIVPIYEAGEVDGLPFIAMGFVDGHTLAKRLADGPLDAREAAKIAKALADGVSTAHRHGIIHRDLKPANVLMDADGQPLITDFGLAKQMQYDDGITQTGQIIGTPSYIAPEQVRLDSDHAPELTDVYSLGAVLYAMCTGRAPHAANNPLDTLLKVLEQEPVRPSKLNRQLPAALEQICRRAIEKKPEHRYASAQALAEDLERFLKDEPLASWTPSWQHQISRWLRSKPVLAAHVFSIVPISLIVFVTAWITRTEWTYYSRHLAALFLWLALSLALQWWEDRRKSQLIRSIWSTLDVVIYTVIIAMAHSPRSPLLIGYGLLIASSGLFAKVRFVVSMTIMVVVANLLLVIAVPDDLANRPHYVAIQTIGLAMLGGIIAAQVKRIRALSRYYESAE
ncbi:MAG: serine/threonine-protein kinase [Pirellulaceae bacterium]